MSMIGHVALLSEQQVMSLLAEPSSVYAVVDDAYNQPQAGFVDLDKAWHCLHYLLTGSAWEGGEPLNFLVKGGTCVGDEDVGYGPARVLRPLEAAALADALSPLSAQALLARFDVGTLEQLEIYPGGWAELDMRSEYELGYFFGPFEELKKLAARAKAERLGMLIWIA